MKRPKCERCRWRLASHALRVVALDGQFVMWSCAACWPQLEAVAREEAAAGGGVLS
jgi:hypothetical protein